MPLPSPRRATEALPAAAWWGTAVMLAGIALAVALHSSSRGCLCGVVLAIVGSLAVAVGSDDRSDEAIDQVISSAPAEQAVSSAADEQAQEAPSGEVERPVGAELGGAAHRFGADELGDDGGVGAASPRTTSVA